MTTKTKMKRVRWLASLTLALLFLAILSPFFLRLLPPTLPDVEPVFQTLSPAWEGTINIIYVLVILFLNACLFVFFIRLFRGIKHGKIFVPGNARWLYIAAWLPIFMLSYRIFYVCFMQGGSGLTVAVLCSQSWHSLAVFSAITLMALLYDVATDVSEENQLTV